VAAEHPETPLHAEAGGHLDGGITDAVDLEEHGEEHGSIEHVERFHHRHETRDGYPILEGLKTDHAFLERKVRIDFASTRGKDDGRADEAEFNGELFWTFGNPWIASWCHHF